MNPREKQMKTLSKPAPDIANYERPYWDAARRGELMLQRVRGTDEFIHPPAIHAPHWHSGAALDWESLGSDVTGRVYSFTVVHRAFGPFADAAPYAVALCDIDGVIGARITANVLGISADQVRIGLPVRLTWEQRGDDSFIPQWEAA